MAQAAHTAAHLAIHAAGHQRGVVDELQCADVLVALQVPHFCAWSVREAPAAVKACAHTLNSQALAACFQHKQVPST